MSTAPGGFAPTMTPARQAADPVAAVVSAAQRVYGKVDFEGNDAGVGGALYMYFKKADDAETDPGFVTVASGHPVTVAQLMKKGMVPLYKYGQFEDFDPTNKWSLNRQPYLRILRLGGAEEFPVAQVAMFGWHRAAPYGLKGLEFPQLKGVEIEEHVCTYCQRRFLSVADLEKHESIRHKTTSEQTSLARHLSGATTGELAKVLEGQQALLLHMAEQQAADRAQLTAILERLADAPKPTARTAPPK